MGVSLSKKEEKKIIDIRKQILNSDKYIKNYPWIFDLEEKIINHKIISIGKIMRLIII
jgi:hypothetical protein